MLQISSTIKRKIPVKPAFFVKAKNKILGRKFFVELVFIGEKKMKSLNRKYRKKNKATDILSFKIEQKIGEIYINLNQAKIKARSQSLEEEKYLKYLFIHGLCHLKGMVHGSRMEYQERQYCRTLKI